MRRLASNEPARFFRADISRLADDRARDTWIGDLVKCACSHGVGRHTSNGCEGDFRSRCRCRLSPAAVIDRAVLDARPRD